MTKNEIAQACIKASALVKTTVGIANNASYMACLDAIDQIRRHPRYNVRVKGGHTVAWLYKRVFDTLKEHERQLIYTQRNRFFHVPDMAPQVRKVYGDITDREYYDFWAAFGFTAYNSTRPFFTSLVNKLRLAYQAHGEAHADILAWSHAAGMTLDMAVEVYECALLNCASMSAGIPQSEWHRLFKDFSQKDVADLWMKAHEALSPASTFEYDPIEEKNILDGYYQLRDMWMNEKTLFGSRIKTAEDYVEVFRTNGEMKKIQRQFAELRDRVEAERVRA